jgi:hypothetical protein
VPEKSGVLDIAGARIPGVTFHGGGLVGEPGNR